jgi:HD-GYP domain-containing protein (c-di-GMP phosphodiesterase class II)
MNEDDTRVLTYVTLAFDTIMAVHDPYEGHDHASRCEHIAEQVAKRMEIPTAQINAVKIGAHLHDVGKIGIPETTLNKPTSLSDAEWNMMRGHCAEGSKILRTLQLRVLDEAAIFLHTHHENWDGSGYPDKLIGNEIPLGAQIIRPVDVFDALTHNRAYHYGITESAALAIMEKGVGTLFSTKVFNTFVRVIKEQK